MITLYGTGPMFGLPDASPFVTKVQMLLKMAKLPYRTAEMSFGKAPKGKIPYIADGGQFIGDSSFIRNHLEKKLHVNFTGGYNNQQLAVAWSVERMLEEHLYWLLVHDRWEIDANFDNGPSRFFTRAPAPLRPFMRWFIRRKVTKTLNIQGLGRHNADEQLLLATGDIDAVANILADHRYLLGDNPCGADATLYSFMLGAQCQLFDSDIRRYIETKPNIMAYLKRLTGEFFPELNNG